MYTNSLISSEPELRCPAVDDDVVECDDRHFVDENTTGGTSENKIPETPVYAIQTSSSQDDHVTDYKPDKAKYSKTPRPTHDASVNTCGQKVERETFCFKIWRNYTHQVKGAHVWLSCEVFLQECSSGCIQWRTSQVRLELCYKFSTTASIKEVVEVEKRDSPLQKLLSRFSESRKKSNMWKRNARKRKKKMTQKSCDVDKSQQFSFISTYKRCHFV